MSEYIVEMKHITKRFPGIVANDDVTIRIKKGEIFALLGENGAGKSTLMSMLFGMYEPDEGEIYIRGEKVKLESPNHATKLNIGMVHQHFKLVSNYTIAENIVMGMEPVKKVLGCIPVVDMKKANQDIRNLSEKYGLAVNPTDVISDINVSTQQRVEILKMLYREAEILIFDEPTAVLTPQEIDFLLDIIKSLRDDGKTIILITHKLEEIKRIADRCAILNRGRLMDVMDVATTSTKVMANKMVGREVNFETEKEPAKPGKTILDIQHLNVYNKQDFQVVKDVSLEVHSGEIVAIAGVAGNGQVEIADAIAGLIPARSGKILLNGRDITNLSIRERTTEGISYIPEDRQNYGLVMDFTLSENLALRNYYKEPFCHKGVLDQKIFEDNVLNLQKELQAQIPDDDPYYLIYQQYYLQPQDWCEDQLEKVLQRLDENKYPIAFYVKIITSIQRLIDLGFDDEYMNRTKQLMLTNITKMNEVKLIDSDLWYIENKQTKAKVTEVITDINHAIKEHSEIVSRENVGDILKSDNWINRLENYSNPNQNRYVQDMSVFSKAPPEQWLNLLHKASPRDIDDFRHWLGDLYPEDTTRKSYSEDADTIKKILTGLESIEEKDLIKKAKVITIASSPFFIEQDYAIKVLKELFNYDII